MKFELTILGSGSATPILSRRPTSQVLNIQERYFLIDCGEGTQLQLRKYKQKFQRIDRVFISHLHGDHYLGVMGFISTLHLLGRTKPLHIHAPIALKEIIDLQLHHTGTYLRFPLQFHRLSEEKEEVIYEDNVMTVSTVHLKHRIPCWGFLFREKEKLLNIRKEKIEEYGLTVSQIRAIKRGADHVDRTGQTIPNEELTHDPPRSWSYAFCSDTKYDETLPSKLKDIDVLYHEATFLKDLEKRAKETYHSTAEQAAFIASKAGVQRLLIGHFSARYPETQSFLEEARTVFYKTEIAEDGKVLRLDEES